jgi:hypothetical protein
MNDYGYEHRVLRESWRPRVEGGQAVCSHPRCGLPIVPGEAWDLAHDPADPRRYVGAQHARCNRNTSLEKRLHGRARRGFRWRSPAW